MIILDVPCDWPEDGDLPDQPPTTLDAVVEADGKDIVVSLLVPKTDTKVLVLVLDPDQTAGLEMILRDARRIVQHRN